MATFLDVSVLGYFGVIFAFLLVFVIVYGVLSFVKPFGEGRSGLYAIVGVTFGVLAVVNKGILFMISFMTPWFFIAIFFGFFIIFILMMFGLKGDQLKAGASPYFRVWPIIVGLLILFFGLGGAFGQTALEQTSGETINDIDEPINVGEVPTSSGIDSLTNTQAGSGEPESTSSSDFKQNIWNTFVNPQILGMILLLFIGAFALFFLTKESID